MLSKAAALAAALMALVGTLTFPPAAEGQAQEASLSAKLVGFPAFVGPEGSLTISLEITNKGSRPLEGLRAAVAVHEGTVTRSQLKGSFSGRLGPLLGSDTIAIEERVPQGETATVSITEPLSEITFFRSAAADRSYPVRITVRTDRAAAAPIDTQMNFFSAPPTIPLSLALVIPLYSPPAYSDGRRPNVITSGAIERAVLEGGRLTRVVHAIERNPATALTLAPSPLLLSTLTDMSNGYARATTKDGMRRVPATDPSALGASRLLERLRALSTRPNISIISYPYSGAFLPALVKAELSASAQAQIVDGAARVRNILGASPRAGWVLPTLGVLDERTVVELQRSGSSRLILYPSSFKAKPQALTVARVVKVRSRTAGDVSALIADPGLAAHLETQGISAVQQRQRLLADSATTMLERPGQSRGVVIVTPPLWAPEQALADDLLDAARKVPWLKSATVEVMMDGLPPPPKVDPLGDLASSDTIIALAGRPPGDDYFVALRSARRSIDEYADLSPPSSRAAALEERLRMAESNDWMKSASSVERGRRVALGITSSVNGEFSKIRAPAAQTITLTSRTGKIPLSVGSALDYPVDVVVRLNSDKLRFPDLDASGRIRIEELTSPNQTIEVRTIAEATGTFPLQVVIETPNRIGIARSRLRVRSTAYNIVGVAITGGAAAFLLAWWIAGIARRRLPA